MSSITAVEYIGQLRRAFEHSQTELETARREVAELTGKPYQPPNNDLLHSLPIDVINPSHFTPILPAIKLRHPSGTSTTSYDTQGSLAEPLPRRNASRTCEGEERETLDGKDEEESAGTGGTRERLSCSTTTFSGERTPETSTREPEEEYLSP